MTTPVSISSNFESPASAHCGRLDFHHNWTRFLGSGQYKMLRTVAGRDLSIGESAPLRQEAGDF